MHSMFEAKQWVQSYPGISALSPRWAWGQLMEDVQSAEVVQRTDNCELVRERSLKK